ncbi:MAG: tryptophan-rich sensory protein [Acidobacteriota bacterium]|nr:tryptophan-rich sensory protein [Acidobacteriota bacterium]
MPDKTNLTIERIRQFLVIAATAGTLFVNYLAGTGSINNKTPADISDQYPTLLTPSGYAFSIWSLIYVGLIAFSIYQALPAQIARFSKIRTLYIINCAANCVWLYLWSYEQILLSLSAIFVMLGTLILININLPSTDSPSETWLARIPFNIYFGWLTVATILNFSIALVFLGVDATGASRVFFASVLIIVAIILGVIIQFKLAIAAYPLTIAWALIAIAIKHSTETVIVTVAAFGVIVLLITALSGLAKSKTSLR